MNFILTWNHGLTVSTVSTVVLECCKGDKPSHGRQRFLAPFNWFWWNWLPV